MAIVKIEGKEITLPDDVVKAGDEAIRAVLAANGFPAIEKAAIEIVGAKGNSPAIVRVSPRSTGKGLKNEALDRIKEFAVKQLTDKYGFCGVADGEDSALINSGPTGDEIIIAIKSNKPGAANATKV